jgi:tetratricopeptide (TPR) repeat protein
MEDGYGRMAARYGYRAPVPVRLELFRSHADFSVRTVGLAGLGALGVSFGSTLAMDSPAARPVGDFNWGSTAWHELAHAFTLGATDHRVPRWFSEGMSVLEERRARSGWGAGATLPFLVAWKAGGIVPPSRLNDGFVRPRHPQEVGWSYYQASLVCEMIEQQWGAQATTAMLRGYREGLSSDDVFRRVLKVEPKELDRRFESWMRQRFATPLAGISVGRAGDDGLPRLTRPEGEPAAGDLVAQLMRGRQLFDAGSYAEAVPFLERANRLFPGLSGEESPRWMLARIHDGQGAMARVAAELDTLMRQGEMPYEAYLLLAKAREATGDRRGAIEALEGAIWMSPYDPAIHQRLAALAEQQGAHDLAIRERRAVVALEPVDRAEALYQLALAYEKAGKRSDARSTVLRALEDAPGFEKAQELLLRLRGGE